MFPKIQRPCPYAGRLAEVMDGDFCRMCKRSVTDLDALDAAARAAFLASCGDEACVSYRLPRAAAAAAFVAVLAAPVTAFAASPALSGEVVEEAMPTDGLVKQPEPPPLSAEDYVLMVGGIGMHRPLTDVPVSVQVISAEDLAAIGDEADPWPRKGLRSWQQPKRPPKKDAKPS